MKKITFTWFTCKYKYTPYITFEKKKCTYTFSLLLLLWGSRPRMTCWALGLKSLSGNTELSEEK